MLTSQTEEFCEKWEASPQQQYYVILTVEEICQAIINNGFTNLKDNYIEITLIANEDGSFELHIRDNATKFNPFDMKTFKIDKNLDNDLDSIGILMIKKNVKQMFYRRYQGFNTLTVLV